ncbi:GFA family protein [Thalassococcus sp. S3]|uniref:GFA family protein n=1 Tax=Thalassococcus sp. S3 TaxID=2017482 RepID=UPI0010246922|nr:GFA family protein [Thalassococcus sp. S3]QBF33768.1 aldehyde-activating protein [Thalassococcus sp. S3]
MLTGSCLCKNVGFEVDGVLSGVACCHCGQCRKQSGHHWASCPVHDCGFHLIADRTLRWYMASETAKRGFCATCESFLFWKHVDEDEISISMSAFDAPTGLTIKKHIFTADKGDYYDIKDDAPQSA